MIFVEKPHRAAGNGLLTGLQSYYKLDEASGTITDAHGAVDSTTENSLTYSATGKINDAVDFNGTTSYAAFGDVHDFSGDFTISCWVNFDSFPTGAYATFIGKGYDGSVQHYYFRLYETGGTMTLEVGTYRLSPVDNVYVSTNVNSWSTGTWYHVVGGYDSTEWFCYYNGGNKATQSGSSPYANAKAFSIGAIDIAGTYSRHMDGRVDEIGVWDIALTSDNVTDLYNSGSGLSYDSFD